MYFMCHFRKMMSISRFLLEIKLKRYFLQIPCIYHPASSIFSKRNLCNVNSLQKCVTPVLFEKSTGCLKYSGVSKQYDIKLSGDFETYLEQENDFFYHVFQSLPVYKDYLFCQKDATASTVNVTDDRVSTLLNQLKENTFDNNSQSIIDSLSVLAKLDYITRFNLLDDKHFHLLSSSFLEMMSTMSDDELFTGLELLGTFPFREFQLPYMGKILQKKIIIAVDAEFLKRGRTWNAQKLLLAASFYFSLRCTKMTMLQYFGFFFGEMRNRFSMLSSHELVLLLFFASLFRRIPNDLHHRLLHNEKLLNVISDLSLDETAALCLGFFKAKKMMYSRSLSVAVVDKLMLYHENCHPITLAAIYKTFSGSFDKGASQKNPEFFSKITNMADVIALKFADQPISTVVNVVLFYTKVLFASENMMKSFVNRVNESDISQWRLKDFARVWQILGNGVVDLDVHVDMFFKSTVDELSNKKRSNEIWEFGGQLLVILLAMATCDLYNQPLIDKVFSCGMLKHFEGYKVDRNRDLHQLDQCVAVDRPKYLGNRLPSDFLSKLPLDHRVFPPYPKLEPGIVDRSTRDCILSGVVQHLNKILGKDNFEVTFCLPHFQTADIIFSLDSIEKSESTVDQMTKQIKKSPKMHHRNVLLVFAKTCYSTLVKSDGQQTKELIGLHRMKARHLQLNGYNVIPLTHYEYEDCEDHEALIRSKILLAEEGRQH